MGSEKKIFSLKDVEDHNGQNDIWIVIHDRVYDVTKFLDEHPGGEEVLKDVAGKIATENFEDVGHSTDARELMKTYEIGEIRDEDKQFTKEKKFQWASASESSSGSSMTWLLPVAAAVVVALAYRYYAA